MALPWSRQRQRVMNCTPAEFQRALVQVFGSEISGEPPLLRLTRGALTLAFQMRPEAGRQLGLLHIAALHVDISVERGDEGSGEPVEDSAVTALLAEFDRATLRGGG